jgi:hypothetical protein
VYHMYVCRMFIKPMCPHSGIIHLTLNCEMHGFRIVQHILDSLIMTIVVCYLVSRSRVSFILNFGNVTLLFSGTTILYV